jgi:DNA end-binding protein Ku
LPSKKLNVVIGFVPIPMRLDKATESGDKSHVVCVGGLGDKAEHPPIRVKQFVECPTCHHEATSHYGFPTRAVEKGDQLVVLSQEDIQAATGEPIKTMSLEFHPREKVYAATLAGGTVNNLRPDKGGEKGYALLRDTLAERPDVVAVAVWAHVSKNTLWVVEVVDDRLVASSRCWPEDVRAVEAVEPPSEEIPDVERQMFRQVVEAKVSDFDMLKYQDTARNGLRELVDSRPGVPIQGDSTTAPDATNMFAALQATLEAAKPVPQQKKPAKKAAAKKAAKKTAAA